MLNGKAAFYTGDGAVLSHYALGVENFALIKRTEIVLPTEIQFAIGHSELPLMYVACGEREGDTHLIAPVHIDPEGGIASGDAHVKLERRPIDIAGDHGTRHCLVAYTNPPGLDVLAVDPDGSLLAPVEQHPGLDVGAFPHEVRVADDNRHCTVVIRGIPSSRAWWRAKGRQKEPGAIRVFEYEDGRLGTARTVTVDDGYEFGPRNMDLHPSGRWAYVAVETQNEIMVFACDEDGTVTSPFLQRMSTLADPDGLVSQIVGPVLVHPSGKVVYVANRGQMPFPYSDGASHIRPEAENTIVAYAVDERSGLITEIQRIDSGGIGPRSIALDPSGRMLIVANGKTFTVKGRDGRVRRTAKNVSTFEVHDDGRLSLRNRYDIDSDPKDIINWAGLIAF